MDVVNHRIYPIDFFADPIKSGERFGKVWTTGLDPASGGVGINRNRRQRVSNFAGCQRGARYARRSSSVSSSDGAAPVTLDPQSID